VSETPQRRNPLRLIVNKETQLRILWLVWGAVFFCMSLAAIMVSVSSQWIWVCALSLGVGTFVSIWVSRQIAGPLYRIEKDIQTLLNGASEGTRIHLREGDHLQHLADLVNQLMERTRK
jgi:signal transduction histidine kinase